VEHDIQSNLAFLQELGSKAPREKWKSANNWPPAPKDNVLVFLCGFFTSSTSLDIMRYGSRPVGFVEQFWCSDPLNSPSDILLFLGWPCEFAKTRSTNPRKARDDCIHIIAKFFFQANNTKPVLRFQLMFMHDLINTCYFVATTSWVQRTPLRILPYTEETVILQWGTSFQSHANAVTLFYPFISQYSWRALVFSLPSYL
jgi:hypothetical protein